MKFKKDISTIGEQCTGCGACSAICPLGCIQMKVDAEGFRMPEIDHTVCLNCGKCVKICPAYNDTIQYDPVRVLAAASYDEEGCQRSSSGGVFYEAARYVIQSLHGYVCGAVLDDDLQLKHIVTDSMRDVVKMQGSKYIQSDITGCYSEIQNHLKKHQVVLFCGTPCQVAGIEHFLGKTNGLVTMDLICHGTPSAYAFSEYMHKKYPEENYFDFSFRQKNIHTKSLFSYHYFSKNKKGNMKIAKRVLSSQDPFYQAFLNGDNYRESCYICKYAKDSRCGDITIGDCANYRAYELPLNKELSTVCINTENGEKMWNAISERFCSATADYKREVQLNAQLHTPARRTIQRNDFYKDIKQMSEYSLKQKYCPRKGIKAVVKDFFIWHTTPEIRDNFKQGFQGVFLKRRNK